MLKSFKKIKINELLFALYLFAFPSFSRFYGNNSIITYVLTILMLLTYIIYNLRENKYKIVVNKKMILVNLSILFFFIMTYLFNNNSMLIKYFEQYILYGIVTMIFGFGVKDYDKVLKYFGYICIVLFVLSFNDPMKGYIKYSGYMTFGLLCSLPCFTIFHMQRKYYNKKIYIIFELLSIISLLYSNRNSILTSILCIFIFDLVLTDESISKKIKYLLFFSLICLFIYNIDLVFSFIKNTLNIDGYAIRAVESWLAGKTTGLAGRDNLWINAVYEIKNNLLIGIGFGGFHAKYGIYCHNLLVDLVVSCGIFGVICIGYIVISTINMFKKFENKKYLLYILMLGISPLLFNNYFMAWKFFWAFIALTIVYERNISSSHYTQEEK